MIIHSFIHQEFVKCSFKKEIYSEVLPAKQQNKLVFKKDIKIEIQNKINRK